MGVCFPNLFLLDNFGGSYLFLFFIYISNCRLSKTFLFVFVPDANHILEIWVQNHHFVCFKEYVKNVPFSF